jgi:hypothetical protein
MVVVAYTAYVSGTTSDIGLSVTDTNGNTWIPLTIQIPLYSTVYGYMDPIQIFYAQNAVGGADTITVNGTAESQYMDTMFAEYSGFPTTGDILEQQIGNAATSDGSATAVAGTLTTSNACDFAVAAFTDMNVGTLYPVSSPFQTEISDLGYNAAYADSGTTLLPVGTSVTGSAPSASGDNSWAATEAIFKVR